MVENYLPSKQFVVRLIIIIILVAGAFSIYKVFTFIKKSDSNEKNSIKLVDNVKKVENDSNNNTIPDWEERLWGLDPTKDGQKNKDFIIERRKALNPNVDLSSYDKQTVSENEGLTQAFFSVVMSLQQTGNLDDVAIEAIANAYSENIEAEPINDLYKITQIKTVSDTEENNKKYYKDIQNLINKYEDSDLGSELSLIMQGIAYNDPQVLYVTQTVALAYRNFGKDLIAINTPEPLSGLHLNTANNCEKVAQSISGMIQLFDDPIIAMKAIINYKKYSDALTLNLDALSYIFTEE